MHENDSKNTQAVDAIAAAVNEATFTWGSAQYDDTAEQYADLCKQEAQNGRNAVHVKYKITVGITVVLAGDLLESLKDALCVDAVDAEVVGDDTSEFRASLSGIKSVTDVLHFLRDQAWDLWSAAPYIAKFVFPELNLGEICHEHTTGVMCWLLKSYNFVVDDEPFKGWDT